MDAGAGAGAGAVVPAGEDIYDYYIKNNLYSDFKAYNETHPWSTKEIKKYITLKTVLFFGNYSEKGYLIHDIHGDNILTVEPVILTACDTHKPEIIMYLIMSGKCDITASNSNGSSLLIRLLHNYQDNIVIMLLTLEITKLRPLIGRRNLSNSTALIWACYRSLPEVALALIATGESNPGAQCTGGFTALINSCQGRITMTEVALALIATGESNPGAQSNDGYTALINTCSNNMTEVALALIATGESNPGAQTNDGYTALMGTCNNEMTEVALALIKTGQSKPETQSKAGLTALMRACINRMTEVALALIATGESNPGAQTNNGFTALMKACEIDLTDVALAILATGNCNSLAVNGDGHDALHYAKTPEVKFWIWREQAYERRRYVLSIS